MIVKGYMIYMARMALIIKFEAGKVFIIITLNVKRPPNLPSSRDFGVGKIVVFGKISTGNISNYRQSLLKPRPYLASVENATAVLLDM